MASEPQQHSDPQQALELQPQGVRVVIAPDSFKGTATATEVAEEIAAGWHEVRPGDELVLLPMADGGEGTVEAFAAAVPAAVRHTVQVSGPDDELVDTDWLLLPDGTAVVELASASGITLLDPLRPHDAHTHGFGEVIAHALDAGAERVLVGLGGSSSTDGGAGMLSALGARLLTHDGAPIASGARGLDTLDTLDLRDVRALPLRGVAILSDVTNPLRGLSGAAAVFGPQKGATVPDIAVLDAALGSLVEAARSSAARGELGALDASAVDRLAEEPGSGAAGGTGFGLLLWGATMAAGSVAVGEAIGLPAATASADVVITGEGRYDAQSAAGKVPSYVVNLAPDGAQNLLVAGMIADDPSGLFDDAVSLVELAGSVEAALAGPLEYARRAGAELARRHSAAG